MELGKGLKPIVNTNNYQNSHTQYLIPGRMKVVMDDRTEEEFGFGDTSAISRGNNAWVLGDELVGTIDFTGFKNYTKRQGLGTTAEYKEHSNKN
jgi:hypothetical protein